MSSKLGSSKVLCFHFLSWWKKLAIFTYPRKKKILNHELCFAFIDIYGGWIASWKWSQIVFILGGSDIQEWGGEGNRHLMAKEMDIWEPGKESTMGKGGLSHGETDSAIGLRVERTHHLINHRIFLWLEPARAWPPWKYVGDLGKKGLYVSTSWELE